MPDWFSLFHRLPYRLQVVGAGVRGWRLQRWRYGDGTEKLVDEATERESWSHVQWELWKEKRLQEQLQNARFLVPWYREWWGARRHSGEEDGWKDLANWPVLTKEEIRRNPRAFLCDDVRAKRLFHFHTSGSTGTPLELWVGRENLNYWYALFEARWRRWNGVDRTDSWAIIGGQRVVAADRKASPFWVWNWGMRQLYISAYHIAPWSVGAILDALKKHEVKYLLGYPSAMADLARLAIEGGFKPPDNIEFLLSNAEPLLPGQRGVLQEFFGCPVVDTYGMTEMVAGAGECSEGRMHLWPEAGHLEILAEDGTDDAVPVGETGRFICTGLVNFDMPLIRYEVGDRGALEAGDTSCACGRSLPALKAIEGRLDDVVVTRDGRRIGRLDTVFKQDLPIRKAQIRQVSLDRMTVSVVPGDGYESSVRAEISCALRARVGEMEITVREVADIPLDSNGKFRGVISDVGRGSDR